MKQSRQFEDILASLYQSYIFHEVKLYRPGIEDMHFLCSSYIMDLLLKQREEFKVKSMPNLSNTNNVSSLELAQKELDQFINYLINQKDAYLNSHIRNELTWLQKNKSNEEYILRYSQFYRYWHINITTKAYERIQFILEQFLLHKWPTIFQEFKQKIKFNTATENYNTLYRNGTVTGLFHYNSRLQNKPDQCPICPEMSRDLDLLNEQLSLKERCFNTFIDDEWIKVVQQIERSQKSSFEAEFTQQDLVNIQSHLSTKNLPYQIAREAKKALLRISLSKNRQQEAQDPGMIQNKSYWDLTKFKLQHDQRLIECILNQRNGLIGGRLTDLANLVSYICVGKFANIIAAGTFDGNIYVYELTEGFLTQAEGKIEFNTKKAGPRLQANPLFDLHLHEGPVTAISILYDEYYMLSVSVELTIKLSCLRTRSPLLLLRSHLRTVWHLAFAPAGYWFASASEDGTALLWATDQFYSLRIFGPSQCGVKLVEFTPSVEYLVTAEEHRAVRVWSIEKAECLFLSFLESPVTTMSISFTGQLIAFGCQDGEVLLYYLPMMKLLKDKIYLQRQDYHNLNSRDFIRSVSISWDEQTLVCCNSSRLAFFSIPSILKQSSEDAFLALNTSPQILEHQRQSWLKNAMPKEMIETQDSINMVKFLPQGFAVYIFS